MGNNICGVGSAERGAGRPILDGASLDAAVAVVEEGPRAGAFHLRWLEAAIPACSASSSPAHARRCGGVASGTVDLECGSTANQLARQKQVAFSVSTFVAQFKWLTRSDSGIASPDDLKRKTVAVTSGTNTSQFLNKLNQDEGLKLTISQGKDHAESFLLVDTGRAAAFMEDDILLAGLKANAKDPSRFKILDKSYSADPYALMFRRDDPAFKAVVDETLVGLMQSGAFSKLYAKWFESPIPPRNLNLDFPMSDTLKQLIKTPSDKAIS